MCALVWTWHTSIALATRGAQCQRGVAHTARLLGHTMATRSIKFVYIPADSAQPIEELQQEVPPEQEVECLTQRLQAHFRTTSKGTNDAGAVKDERRKMLQQHMKGGEVSEDMLDAVGDMQLVESVALLSGGPHNDFVHVNLYVDDTGSLKGLPHNGRASSLASEAGYPVDVRGDAFVGRVMDSDAEFQRLDFTFEDMKREAAWMVEARRRNAQRRENSGKLEELVPGATKIDMASAAARGDADADALQQAAPGGGYTYSQSREEVTIEVKVPTETKAGHVKCSIKPDSISLSVATLGEGKQEVLHGDLFQKVRPDECSWTLAQAGQERLLQVTLSKVQPLRWLGVLRSG